MMRGGAGLDPNQAWRQLLEERQGPGFIHGMLQSCGLDLPLARLAGAIGKSQKSGSCWRSMGNRHA
jgi:hypothetical protein